MKEETEVKVSQEADPELKSMPSWKVDSDEEDNSEYEHDKENMNTMKQ